jgi:Uncharacterized protein conserved in bacteria (DUF2188)
MPNLPKYTLSHDEKKNDWALREDRSGRVKKRFDSKSEATAGGVLRRTVGSSGGSVKIQKMDGTFQEERTFPRSKDPKRSPG